jgi:RNA polymerase sigma factor for flagellar operon FliA
VTYEEHYRVSRRKLTLHVRRADYPMFIAMLMTANASSRRSRLLRSTSTETVEPEPVESEPVETEPVEPKPSEAAATELGRNELLTELMPLVKRMALKMRERLPAHIQVDDLVGAGALGLVDAVRKFDPRKRVKIEKYAKLRIRGAMLDGLRDLDVASRDLRKKSKKVERVYRELEAKLARPVTDEEMAQALQLSLAEWHETTAQLQALGVEWLRPMVLGGVKRVREESLVAENQKSQFDLCYSRERKEILGVALACLSARDRMIIKLYYDEGRTMKQIAHKLGIDESRISQLHSAALVRLRSLVEAKTKVRRRSQRELAREASLTPGKGEQNSGTHT